MIDINAMIANWRESLAAVTQRNEVWDVAISAAIIIIGFTALELLWRQSTRWFDKRAKRKWKKVISHFSGFLPPMRLAVAILLVRLAEKPLTVPGELLDLIHGLESFLLALVMILLFFQAVRLMEPLYTALPSAMKGRIPRRAFRRFTGILRITGIVLVAVAFVYTQKRFFPEWLWQHSWWRYVVVLLVCVVLVMTDRLIGIFFSSMVIALKTAEERLRLRLVLESSLVPIHLLLLTIAVYAITMVLMLPPDIGRFADITINVLAILVVAVFAYRLLDILEYELTKLVAREDNKLDRNFVQLVRIVSRVLVVAFGVIYLLQAVTGKPMNTLLAGLGIGGLAVALAAQDTLKNLFGSIMIMLDKPFVVGDWVIADGVEGTVEEIGFRSTRIRTFPGKLVAIPNERMAAINIENVQLKPYMRRWLDITITYDTPPAKVERAVQIIKDILAEREEVKSKNTPKVLFSDFNDASLNILVVYWFYKNDFWEYRAFNEEINFAIMRAFEREGIEFAFPTTTTYLAQDDRRPLTVTVSHTPTDGDPVE